MNATELTDIVANLVPHTLTGEQTCARLMSAVTGLSAKEARRRLGIFGPNSLPQAKPPGVSRIIARQFLSPLIYILLIAAALSMFIGEWIDALFIFGVLLVNAGIGASQEYQAQKSAQSLEKLVSLDAVSVRDGVPEKLKAVDLVPGDIVLIESGNKVPADIRLLQENELLVDESLLTGESEPDSKDADFLADEHIPVADRLNMLFGGTLVLRGRGRGIVVSTGGHTELGRIVSDVQMAERAVPPLMQRMKKFTAWVGAVYVVVITFIGLVAWLQGEALLGILLIAVALAVAAIPEGLPVAITVSLAVGMSRMARNNVITRRLVAAETLGSCTLIASDKTGTLTVNRLTARYLQFPGESPWMVTGEGSDMDGKIQVPEQEIIGRTALARIGRLARAAVFCNEGSVLRQQGEWIQRGDSVDVALLVLAWKAGQSQDQLIRNNPMRANIPFESERRYSASLNKLQQGGVQVSVKGALENILPMCSTMLVAGEEKAILPREIISQAEELGSAGYRVLAFADKRLDNGADDFSEKQLKDLCFIGIVGMIDPPRPEAKQAIEECRRAGVSVVMVTGDHPITAQAIARQIGLADELSSVVSGSELTAAKADSEEKFNEKVLGGTIFARIDPHQKLEIVQTLTAAGQFVAVTGDGANDAPALRVAHVGVAMGKSGTDVARESSEIIITDDNFASLVAGIREGRIAYANVRKVIFLLISTGAVEIVAFVLSLFAGLPVPLTAVQLLWLNLVTEGIQDVALAFEPGEGDEMKKPPRPPDQPIFDRLMIERVVISALTMGTLAFIVFWYQYSVLGASIEASRNIALLFLVMFENIQVFNSRSETVSIIRQPFFNNKLLLTGTVAAQAIHILAMYTPGLSSLLDVQPVSLDQWSLLMATAFSMLLMMELHKGWWAYRHRSARDPFRT